MINVSISYGFGKDNRYNDERIPKSIQLALYKYHLWDEQKDDIVNAIYQNNISVKAVHLPLDTMKRQFGEILELIKILHSTVLCNKFVIHPNKGIHAFIQQFLNTGIDAQLCIENFQHRKKKEFRNPLYIIEKCIQYGTPRLRVCLDTSHTEGHWFHPHIMPYILNYTSIIHLSNRKKGKGSHIPFNMQDGDLNLVGFVKELKKRYHWKGDIVLEYMPEYRYKLHKNQEYLMRKRMLWIRQNTFYENRNYGHNVIVFVSVDNSGVLKIHHRENEDGKSGSMI